MSFRTGTSQAVVRTFDPELGWGVLDAPELSGGCWVHWSVLQMDGYRQLRAGETVSVEWEAGEQDGYRYRAVSVSV